MISITICKTLGDMAKWQSCFAQTRRANLLQSIEYGLSYGQFMGQKPRQAFIQIDGQPAGICQLMEAGVLNNAIHAIIVDRGPLWLDGFGAKDHQVAFWQEFDRLYKRRLGRKRRIFPELTMREASVANMEGLGFKRLAGPGYQTIWLDLRPGLDVLRGNLKSKWRGPLSKAERSDLEVQWDSDGTSFPMLLNGYVADKGNRGYQGPSSKLLQILARYFSVKQNLLIGRALQGATTVAAIMILCHGRSATYQTGWTTPAGRACNAHNLLLWNALQVLQDRNIQDFDLGGVSDGAARAVKKFKEGMGGETVELLGIFN
jgi:GNAT acetyltransferase-like protein